MEYRLKIYKIQAVAKVSVRAEEYNEAKKRAIKKVSSFNFSEPDISERFIATFDLDDLVPKEEEVMEA